MALRGSFLIAVSLRIRPLRLLYDRFLLLFPLLLSLLVLNVLLPWAEVEVLPSHEAEQLMWQLS